MELRIQRTIIIDNNYLCKQVNLIDFRRMQRCLNHRLKVNMAQALKEVIQTVLAHLYTTLTCG